jgi:hypothetical protein
MSGPFSFLLLEEERHVWKLNKSDFFAGLPDFSWYIIPKREKYTK